MDLLEKSETREMNLENDTDWLDHFDFYEIWFGLGFKNVPESMIGTSDLLTRQTNERFVCLQIVDIGIENFDDFAFAAKCFQIINSYTEKYNCIPIVVNWAFVGNGSMKSPAYSFGKGYTVNTLIFAIRTKKLCNKTDVIKFVLALYESCKELSELSSVKNAPPLLECIEEEININQLKEFLANKESK